MPRTAVHVQRLTRMASGRTRQESVPAVGECSSAGRARTKSELKPTVYLLFDFCSRDL